MTTDNKKQIVEEADFPAETLKKILLELCKSGTEKTEPEEAIDADSDSSE